MTEYEARTRRPLKGYHLGEDRTSTIPGGALVHVTVHRGQVTATCTRADGPYGINLDTESQVERILEETERTEETAK